MDEIIEHDNGNGEHGYGELLGEVKSRIRTAQYEALRAVNKELIDLYWNIGKLIVERQQGYTWGYAVVERLADDIQTEFPSLRGFSARSIWYMRDFYLAYHGSQKLPPLVAEIGWSHNRAILDKCKDDLEREFYIRMTKSQGWTKNVLIHQIGTGLTRRCCWPRPTSTPSCRTPPRRNWPSRTNTCLTSWNWATSSASGSLRRPFSPAWSRS